MALTNGKYFAFLKSWLQDDYERNKLNMTLGGWTAFLAHPAYYLICTYFLVGYYDSPFFRFGSALLSLPLILTRWAPDRSKPWLNAYWYFWIVFVLPVSFTYILLMNAFAPMWVMCETMMIFVTLVFIGNALLSLLVLGIGIPVGYLCFSWYTGNTIEWGQKISSGDLAWSYPVAHLLVPLPIALWCGIVFAFGAKRALMAIERSKAVTALAGSIAHEMRNPLGQAKFSLDSLQHGLPSPSLGDGRVEMEARDVNALYSHIAQGKIAIERGLQAISMTLNEVSGKPISAADLSYAQASELVHKAIGEYCFESEGERAKVGVVVKQDFVFKVDETLFVFVLFNLLKNALYYFKLHSEATITVTVDQFTVIVRDTGPGIPPQVLSKLFGNFATSGKAEGTGLGLAFCKRTMLAFGGDITCNSEVGQYTEFKLQFPTIDDAEIQRHEDHVLANAQSVFNGTRVLVVDDQPLLRKLTRLQLDGLGCTVDEAENGEVAIKKLRERAYDLVTMDLNMPVLDGYAASEKIRQGQAPLNKTVPIVAYTSESAYMAEVKTQKVGMNGFVSKPCNRLHFIKTIHGVVQNAASKRDIEDDSSEGLQGKVVLVADDEAFNRKIAGLYLNSFGATMLEATHGTAVIEILESGQHVDAILMDMQMPGLGGVETTRAIRQREEFSAIPILALTANFSEESIRETASAGMNDFISKPFEVEQLREKLILAMKNVEVRGAAH